MTRLRYALLAAEPLARWHLRCLARLDEVADRAAAIVPGDRAESAAAARRSLADRVLSPPDLAPAADATKAIEGLPRVRDIDVADANCDFVLKLGSGAVPAALARATRYGVWFFEHESDGDPLPFSREVCYGIDVTEAALMCRSEGEPETIVLEAGWFKTEKRSYAANRDRVLGEIADWPALMCCRIAVQPELDRLRRRQERAVRPGGGTWPLGRLCASVIRARAQTASERLFRHRQWNVGVLPVSAATLLGGTAYDDSLIRWFPLRGRRAFLADPFGIPRGDGVGVLCERFDFWTAIGSICALELSDGRFTGRVAPAIDLTSHMSYPCLINHDGSIYCVAETSQASEIALFRAVDYPRTWTKTAVLVPNLAGVDPTVFRHEDRWWLMCTSAGVHADVKLWAWHATDLTGPWQPHALNPIKIDVRGARPGGAPFVNAGTLYRPTQDCSKMYGWRVVVQRVNRLTPVEFDEEPAAAIEASPASPFPVGRHTFTPVGDVVLIDGSRTVFVWPAFVWFLRIWANDLLRRARPPAQPGTPPSS